MLYMLRLVLLWGEGRVVADSMQFNFNIFLVRCQKLVRYG